MDTRDYVELETIQDQTSELMEVWTDISKVWTAIDQMGDTTLSAAQPLQMMRIIDNITEGMNELPNKYRSLEPFTAKKDLLKKYKKVTILLRNMKTDTMKPKHWK